MQDEKTSLSDQKLRLEIDELRKPWYKKSSFLQSQIASTLIIGIILACFTVLFNYLSAKSLVRNSFVSEFNKLKAQKIGETWEVLNIWEAETDEFLLLTKQIFESKENNYKAIDTNRLNDLYKTVLFDTEYNKVNQNRFWIGEEQFKLIDDFIDLILRKQKSFINYNQDSINMINDLINRKRTKLDEVLNKMLDDK